MTTGWLACSPGVLDCGKVDCKDSTGGRGGSGAGGEGGEGGGGGMGGAGGGGPSAAPEACKGLGINNLSDVETKFIMPKCGASACHQAVFPPRNLNMQAKIRENMVGKTAGSLCKQDQYINKADPSKSYVLAKINSDSEMITCPTGGGDGGSRMPNIIGGVAGKADKKLSDDEIACFTWWVEEVAKL